MQVEREAVSLALGKWLAVATCRALEGLGFHDSPFFFGSGNTAQQLGRRSCRELFSIERRYHDLIEAEPSAAERFHLYAEINDSIKQFKKRHLPVQSDFGFDPKYIESNADLFRGRIVVESRQAVRTRG